MNEILELKATLSATDTGEITGIAWPFGSGADSAGDLITKNAFNIVSADMPMLYQHSVEDLIGTWSSAAETSDGLVVKGKLHMDQPRARSVLALVKGGLVSGLSIGFKTKASTQQGRNRVISALDLFEVSLVRNPAHPKARVLSAKQFNSANHIAVAAIITRATAALSQRTT